LAKRQAVQGVLSLSEFGVVSAACAAAALGLPGIGIESARNATNKWRMRSKWAAAKLPQPESRVIRDEADVCGALEALGLPLICKPCSSAASRAVTRVRNASQLGQPLRQPSHRTVTESLLWRSAFRESNS